MSNEQMILPNGATVLKIDMLATVVLAQFRDEYVTWAFNENDMSCYWGHYFGRGAIALDEASADYAARCAR